MSEKLPVDQLEKIVDASGEAINVVHKVSHGGGIFSVLSIVDELSALGLVKGDVVLAQLKDLDVAERKQLLGLLKAKVALSDKALEAKIEAGVDCLDEVVDYGFKIYADGLAMKVLIETRVAEGKVLIEKIKSLTV
jgi:hypothetical protein